MSTLEGGAGGSSAFDFHTRSRPTLSGRGAASSLSIGGPILGGLRMRAGQSIIEHCLPFKLERLEWKCDWPAQIWANVGGSVGLGWQQRG